MRQDPLKEVRSFPLSDFMPLVRGAVSAAVFLRGLFDEFSSRRSKRAAQSAPRTVSAPAIIRSFTLILVLYVVCDAVAVDLGVPLPGAAIAMLLLLAVFTFNGGPDVASERTFDAIAPHIPVFFVPAATGIMVNADRFGRAWIAILIAIVLGSALTLILTGRLMQSAFDAQSYGAGK